MKLLGVNASRHTKPTSVTARTTNQETASLTSAFAFNHWHVVRCVNDTFSGSTRSSNFVIQSTLTLVTAWFDLISYRIYNPTSDYCSMNVTQQNTAIKTRPVHDCFISQSANNRSHRQWVIDCNGKRQQNDQQPGKDTEQCKCLHHSKSEVQL